MKSWCWITVALNPPGLPLLGLAGSRSTAIAIPELRFKALSTCKRELVTTSDRKQLQSAAHAWTPLGED